MLLINEVGLAYASFCTLVLCPRAATIWHSLRNARRRTTCAGERKGARGEEGVLTPVTP